MIEKLRKLSDRDLQIIKNMAGAFIVKGGAVIVSFILLPLYINFFNDNTILGLWYTILSVLSWVTLFDLGLGHGLRNKLPPAIEEKNTEQITSLISTTYVFMILIGSIVLVVGEIIISRLNWNKIFHISSYAISDSVLIECVQIVFFGVVINVVLKIITAILYAIQYSAIVNFLTLVPNIIILVLLCVIPSGSLEMNLKTMSIVNVCAINLPYIVCTWIVFRYLLKDHMPSIHFFRKDCIKDIFTIGISILWLQIAYMVISSTNEFVITYLTSADYVVEYQIYYKIFKTGGMIVSLTLTPIWSAVTKAQAQKNYQWIRKIYKIFLLAVLLCVLLELCIIPILPGVVDIWIGEGAIAVSYGYALVFVFSNTIAVLHSVNTTIGNGLSYFKVQLIGMTFAILIFFPLSYLLVHLTGSWIGVVAANTVSLIPYEFLAPVFTTKMLNRKIRKLMIS